MAPDTEVTPGPDGIATDEELLARINTPLLSAVFMTAGETYGVTLVAILRGASRSREKIREVVFRAQQAAIYILVMDCRETPERVNQLFARKFLHMTGKCRGIGELASIDSVFMRNVQDIRAKLREQGLLPIEAQAS